MRNTYEFAQKKVKKKKEFYQHLTSFITVGAFLLAINAATSFGTWWFFFPLLGWSIGLMIHYFNVFGIPGLVNNDEEWEEQAIEKEVARRADLLNIHKTESEYRQARKKIKKRKEFYNHFGAYIAVGFFFFAMNVVTSFGDWWFHLPMLGWGIGLATHYITVFGIGQFSERWEERAIQQEMQKLNRRESEMDIADNQAPEVELDLPELEKNAVPRKKWDDSQLV